MENMLVSFRFSATIQLVRALYLSKVNLSENWRFSLQKKNPNEKKKQHTHTEKPIGYEFRASRQERGGQKGIWINVTAWK